jgi:hypothetical protein
VSHFHIITTYIQPKILSYTRGMGGGAAWLMKLGFGLETGFVCSYSTSLQFQSLALLSHTAVQNSLGHFFGSFSKDLPLLLLYGTASWSNSKYLSYSNCGSHLLWSLGGHRRTAKRAHVYTVCFLYPVFHRAYLPHAIFRYMASEACHKTTKQNKLRGP